MTLLTNAKRSTYAFTSVMNSIVQASKSKDAASSSTITLTASRVKKVEDVLRSLGNGDVDTALALKDEAAVHAKVLADARTRL